MQIFHSRIGEYLRENPTSGVVAIDLKDGLGPRCEWPSGLLKPDVGAWCLDWDVKQLANKKIVDDAEIKLKADILNASTIAGLKAAMVALLEARKLL